MPGKMITVDGNYAASHVAYALSEVAAIYPITPSSTMGELADEWASQGKKNIWGREVSITEMQSEAGAAGAVHGALVGGSLTTTFTASQGLLLMIPNMYKIAGEMIPTVFHVSARALAAQALAIFGDHSDVMAVRNTGFAMISANSVQEEMDLALVSHLATLKSKVPFLSFFDGFRTSHELHKIEEISYETIASLVEQKYIDEFRARALRPESPISKVGAQNPDVYFQGRETVNKFYDAVPGIVKEYMKKVGDATGRHYNLFDYVGAADATDIIVAMGSSCETIEETIEYLNAKEGKKLGLIKVRLYRPFFVQDFLAALPKSVKRIAVLDRTKEPGAIGEPLFLDVKVALDGRDVKVIGGRYGLASKEFTPSMVAAIFDHLAKGGFHGFTVGINDDVTKLSLPVTRQIQTAPEGTKACTFWGLGGDGTVGANHDSIKIIGDNTKKFAQGYFSYDSKKSYGVTVSHLRFGDKPIKSTYLIDSPDFVACHNPAYIGRFDMLAGIKEGGIFLLNTEVPADKVFETLTKDMQETIIKKKIKFFAIDALKVVAAEPKLRGKGTNVVMMVAFFKISGIIDEKLAIGEIRKSIQKRYKKKGDEVINLNLSLVDKAESELVQVKIPASADGLASYNPPKLIADDASQFAKDVIEPLMHLKGDEVPVSKMSVDGTLPTGTACLEKRGIAPRVPQWISENCIQCNMCVMSCPHAVVRAKQIKPADLKNAPASFKTVKSKTKNTGDLDYKIQIYPEDCTGCGVCVETCPAKTKALEFTTLTAMREAGEVENAKFFDALPDNVTEGAAENTVKGAMFKKPLFEFSGACAGCGETPYVKLITQLFGENMVVANATGCSSIYGGTFPTIPYTKSKEGRGPAWANSLFEDNAEFGLGMRLAIDSNREILKLNVGIALEKGCDDSLKNALGKAMELWEVKGKDAVAAQDAVKAALPGAIAKAGADVKTALLKIQELQDYFVDKSVWILGGDGWAYDIGYGGVDHVVASGKNVNILVLDTEVYSNTGGQASKSTPIGAVAKFASGGKDRCKKNLGFMCMSYGYVYAASIAMGADRNQTLKALIEAEAHKGPSIVMAYAPCIAHGIDMMKTQTEEKRAVEAGYWPLYRYNPGAEKPFSWDTKPATGSYQDFIKSEGRYKALLKVNPAAEELFQKAEADAKRRMTFFQNIGQYM